MMRVHFFQHVPFEGLGSIGTYIKGKGHSLSSTQWYKHTEGEKTTVAPLPALDSIDFLIVMGGPMGVYDEKEYPWIKAEKEYISRAIEADKIVLGICLGAQLIAHVLGATISTNKYREIGWHSLSTTQEVTQTCFQGILPSHFTAFHWHGDTFGLPPGATLLASSTACYNQAFSYKNKVLGLQFHLETTLESAQALIQNCAEDIDVDSSQHPYVQTASEILNKNHINTSFSDMNSWMNQLLNALEQHNFTKIG